MQPTCADPRDIVARSQFVGRKREQQVLRDRMIEAITGRGGLVLVSGDAGIGKTTLVDDLSRCAQNRGAIALAGGCYDYMSTRPYAPWLEMMTVYASLHAERGLPAVPQPLRLVGTADGLESKQAFFDAIVEFIRLVSMECPLLLMLEDLHSADAASLDLLRHIGHSLDNVSALLVGTYRDDELTRQHPLFQLLPLLVGETHSERIALRPLDRAATDELISVRYGLAEEDAERLTTQVYQQTAGNPLFVRELLRDLEHDGVLRLEDGGWVLGNLERSQVPTLVRQVIESRLARLGMHVRRALQIAAVIGQEFDYPTWLAMSGMTDDDLVAVLERAIDAHLIQETSGTAGARFTHALVRQAIYESVIGPNRHNLHRQVAELLETGPNPDPARVAYHYQQAGDARGAAWFGKAATRAERVYALLTAAEQLEAAISLLNATGEQRVESGWLLYRLAAMRRYDDPRTSIRHLEQVERQASELGDRLLGACALLNRGLYRCWVGELRLGISEMETAVARFDALTPADLDRFDAMDLSLWHNTRRYWGTLIIFLAEAGRYTEAAALAMRPSRPDIGGPDNSIAGKNALGELVEDYYGLGGVYAYTGRPVEARAAYRQAREGYRRVNHHYQVAWTALDELTWVIMPYYTDDVAARYRLADVAVQAWTRARGSTVEQLPELPRLSVLYLEGKWSEAHRIIARATDAVAGETVAVPVLTALAYHQGDVRAARELIDLILPEGVSTMPGDTYFASAVAVQRLAASIELDGGNLDGARGWLEAHDSWLSWSGSVPGRAEGQLIWARYYQLFGKPARARAHAREALEHAHEPRQPLALISAHRVLGQLNTETGHPVEAEQHLKQSLALAELCVIPFERALTLLALAELRGATGKPEAARVLLDEVHAICDPLGAAPTLARTEELAARLAAELATPNYPGGLTAREVDVLRLVAEGLTDREIAARLFIGRRTVSWHVTNILNKLGLDSRTALATFAVRHQLL